MIKRLLQWLMTDGGDPLPGDTRTCFWCGTELEYVEFDDGVPGGSWRPARGPARGTE